MQGWESKRHRDAHGYTVAGGASTGHSSSSAPNFSTVTLSSQLILCCSTRLNNSFYFCHPQQTDLW